MHQENGGLMPLYRLNTMDVPPPKRRPRGDLGVIITGMNRNKQPRPARPKMR